MNGSKEGQTHPVLKRIAHPQYKKPSRYHDIALLKIGPAIEDDAHSTLRCDRYQREIRSIMIAEDNISGNNPNYPHLGDSGGPLQSFHHKGSCLHTVVGLTSFGKVCGIKGTLGIYTRVAYYLKWIEENTWKGRKC
ncbi:hypothetical protein J437_LFUL001788 [Ladona fulva]|uniref:Peptidase S1 domain-containing protein n=1 Tax=Ladona fulva TaxID=123851 RepID=A0A8K0JX74_LADFU|nr:hypothetical protein J437_LFUL001788 [Ladona fulva]